jgi:hypothetical protein
MNEVDVTMTIMLTTIEGAMTSYAKCNSEKQNYMVKALHQKMT